MKRSIFTSLFLVAACALPSAAQTQGTVPALSAPDRIILYTHESLAYRDFIDPLMCALQAVLEAPVENRIVDFPLTPDMLETETQYSPIKMAPVFMQATLAEEDTKTFKFLLVPHDLKAGPYNYLFAQTFGGVMTSFHFSIVSTARLDPVTSPEGPAQRPNTLADRVYKIAVRAVARLAGYATPEGCVLAFPRSLEELDIKPREFCEEDHAILSAVGILRDDVGEGCLFLSSTMPARRSANG